MAYFESYYEKNKEAIIARTTERNRKKAWEAKVKKAKSVLKEDKERRLVEARAEISEEHKKGVSHNWMRKEKDANLRATFGITLKEYEDMLANQNYGCFICGKKHKLETRRGLAVDHCHTSGKVRGLLCMNCNTAIGHLRDDKRLFYKAIEYLDLHHPEESDGKA